MKAIYGVLNSKRIHADVSNTLQGAKNYATRHGYKEVSKRNSYGVYTVAKKINNKWKTKIEL